MVIPAVDVLDHKVVQLVGGELGSQKIILPDPFRTAMSWVEKGAP
ncbi:MAG: 1-(5-phosphoribosyl)-5-[(5-phosphoribosylamino)methylideneamino] imidazole-4-carboxamide isomerase, partial [Candidatus Methanoplasma sp.]|nr:1-(5-phosphoribosyl)-5-[(5-phosphoribosylamino)methylideneamino] imidazole-4-carboxamide isomerase [Candidatus Methanoplasma sp.]